METPDNGQQWEPEPHFPGEPEFYRRVLHFLHVPVIVIDGDGMITYANQALLTLGGWTFSDVIDLNVLNYVHPDDRDALATSFFEIAASPGARILNTGRPWAEIYFRIVAADGTAIPIELVGNGGMLDPFVNGIIYTVRPARTRNLLGRVLDGLSQGASMHHLLSLVAEMITSPPLDLEAVIMQSTSDDNFMIASSTSTPLSEILRAPFAGMPWEIAAREPTFVAVRDLPDDVATRLQAAGFNDIWHVAVESPLTASTLRIIAASPTHHVPANGPKNRLVRARELASAVLLRTQADVLLARSAARDPLTDLPNRAAFYQLAELVNPMLERAALHLDLDGLKLVNDEFGQAAGDAVLQVVADRLRSNSGPNDIIGRLGDDEFAILLQPEPNETLLSERALSLASAALKAIEETVVVAGRPLSMSTSIGVSLATGGISTDHLLTWADAAMHEAKRAGGGRVHRFGVSYG